MGQWVRVFLQETSTQNVPEGLEEYIKEPTHSDDDSISVASFSVLKQWVSLYKCQKHVENLY